MKLKYAGGEIDLTLWEFDCGMVALDYMVGGAATHALRTAFENEVPWVFLPGLYAYWDTHTDGHGGPPVEPLTLEVQFDALAAGEDKGTTLSVHSTRTDRL
jgi:hypothetical protein